MPTTRGSAREYDDYIRRMRQAELRHQARAEPADDDDAGIIRGVEVPSSQLPEIETLQIADGVTSAQLNNAIQSLSEVQFASRLYYESSEIGGVGVNRIIYDTRLSDSQTIERIPATAETPLTPTDFYCGTCGVSHNIYGINSRNDPTTPGRYICQQCFDRIYIPCRHCGTGMTADSEIHTRLGALCTNCHENNYFTCTQCDEFYSDAEYQTDGMCQNCARDSSTDYNSSSYDRPYSTGSEYVGGKDRIYAVELETYYQKHASLKDVANAVPKGVGIHNDGSLSGKSKEFVTPMLSGKEGDKLLKLLCSELIKNDFYVNKSCGLHVHLNAPEFITRPIYIMVLLLFYLAFEPVIFSYLPLSRRKNRYCLPLSEFFHEQEIKQAQNLKSLESLWYREQSRDAISARKSKKYDSTRYTGINLHSLLSSGHLEIRYHSGTLDYTKIKMWADLHIAILDSIIKGKIISEQLADVKYLLTLEEKQDAFFKLINLSEPLQAYFKDRQKKFGVQTPENIIIESE